MLSRILKILVLIAIPAAASTEWPNEPTGATLIADNNLNVFQGGGWTCYCNPNPSPGVYGSEIFNDATAPLSGPGVLRMRYPMGFGPGGISPGNYYLPLPAGLKEIYIGFWWKASAGFESNLAGTKVGFIKNHGINNTGGTHTVPFLFNDGGVLAKWKAGFYLPSSPEINNCGLNWSHYGECPGTQNVFSEVSILRNTWYRWEIYEKRSTTYTSADGVLRLWITPQGGSPILAINATNLNTPQVGWEQYEINPTWGGNGGYYGDGGATTDGFFSYDHIRISSPNCGPSGCAADIPVTILTGSLPSVASGRTYSATLQANGGKAPYYWTIVSGSLHQGLTLNKTTGVISGTVTSCGRADFTVKVMDSSVPAKEATKNLSIIASGTCTSALSRESSVVSKEIEQRLGVETKAGTVLFHLPKNGAYSLRVYDLSGKIVGAYAGQDQIEIRAELKNGIYVAKVFQEGQESAIRFNVLR